MLFFAEVCELRGGCKFLSHQIDTPRNPFLTLQTQMVPLNQPTEFSPGRKVNSYYWCWKEDKKFILYYSLKNTFAFWLTLKPRFQNWQLLFLYRNVKQINLPTMLGKQIMTFLMLCRSAAHVEACCGWRSFCSILKLPKRRMSLECYLEFLVYLINREICFVWL